MNEQTNIKDTEKESIKANFSRLWAICIKFLKTSYRDKPMYFWVFGYPLLFMLIYFIAFSGGGGGTTYDIAFINNDGDPLDYQTEIEAVDFSSEFLIDLFEDNSPYSNLSETFNVHEIESLEAGIDDIQSASLDAIIIIPANFSELILGEIEGTPVVVVYTSPDPYDSTIVPSVIQSIVNQLILDYEDVESLNVVHESTGEKITPFDWMMPGIVIAGTTVAIMNVAQLFGKERDMGLLERLETTPVPRSVQLLGGGLAQMIFSTIQGLILLLCLVLFGVNMSPNANWGGALLMVLVTAFMCIGIGMILAASVKEAATADGLAWIVILPLQFFGGTIMALGTPGVPTHYSVIGMRNALIDGFSLSALMPNIGIVFGYGCLFYIIAIVIFMRRLKV